MGSTEKPVSCVCVCARVHVCGVCTWGNWKPGDPGASYCVGWVPKASYWPSSWSARDGKMMRPLVSFMFMWVPCFLSALVLVTRCVYLTCVFACVPIGKVCSASILVGLGRGSCSSLASIRLLNSAIPNENKNKRWISQTSRCCGAIYGKIKNHVQEYLIFE